MKHQANTRSVMTIQDWFFTILVTMVVPLGLIMLFVWVFNPSTNENKANYAKAVLLFYGMLLIVYLGYMVIFGIAILNSFSSM